MLARVYIILIAAGIAVAPCLASPASNRDGSTKAKAIPLKQRNPAKAVEEEMAWMMKLYHYTPLLATRDAMVAALRKAKAGKKEVHVSGFWGHASVDYNGHLISDWWFPTPRGKRELYFDTGTMIKTPGEVVRQESARAEYMGRMMPQLKLQ
jgi:hypothetical protein